MRDAPAPPPSHARHTVSARPDPDDAHSAGSWPPPFADAGEDEEGAADELWPEGLRPDVEGGFNVCLSRTLAEHEGHPGAQEVLAVYQRAIASAKHFIYAENQYFTSARIARFFADALAKDDGPQVRPLLRAEVCASGHPTVCLLRVERGYVRMWCWDMGVWAVCACLFA